MIIPDVNLLVYAYNKKSPPHERSKAWWERTLNSQELVGLPWAVTLGFVRLMSNRAVLVAPLSPELAIRIVESWLELNTVSVLEPGENHLALVRQLVSETAGSTKLVMDAHVAALAITYNCTIHSNDCDFARFSGLKWRNPLVD